MKDKITVYGLNLNRIPDAITRRCVKMYKVCKKDRKLSFYADSANINKIKQYLDNGYEYEIRPTGIKLLLEKIFKRIGLLIGFSLTFIGLIIINSFVLKVEITGGDSFSRQKIEKMLDDKNICAFVKKSDVDCNELKKLVYTELDMSTKVDVRIVGNTLKIRFDEEQALPEIIGFSNKDIISTADAVITRIVCINGTPQVKVGQAVKKGDVLIAAYTLIGDEQVACNAVGEVYGTVYNYERIVATGTVIESRKTGKTETFRHISFKKTDIEDKCSFEKYEKKVNFIYISDILPIYIIENVYCETVDKSVEVDAELQSKLLVKDVLDKIKIKMSEGNEIERYWTIQKKVDNYIIIDVYYQIEQMIAEAT